MFSTDWTTFMTNVTRYLSLNCLLDRSLGKDGIVDNVFTVMTMASQEALSLKLKKKYRQPGLKFKIFRKKIFFGTKVSEAFSNISQNLKVTRLQEGTQTKL
jgi:hypothetical protein